MIDSEITTSNHTIVNEFRDICSKCKLRSMPKRKSIKITAVQCQNPTCEMIIEFDDTNKIGVIKG